MKGSLNSKSRFYPAATERRFRWHFVLPPGMFWNICSCISPGAGKQGTGDMSFPKDLSLGLKCYMFGTCQKLAFWHKFDTSSFQSVLKLKKKFCLSKKILTQFFFLLHRHGSKKRNAGPLSSLKKIMIVGTFLAITRRFPDTSQIRWVSLLHHRCAGRSTACHTLLGVTDGEEEKPTCL